MKTEELEIARKMLADVQRQISEAANQDQRLAFSLNRYVFKNLSYVERGTPVQRTKLKLAKLIEQDGKYAYSVCPTPEMPMRKEDEPELDRIDAFHGYTRENTVLVHHQCHRLSQKAKGFS